MTTIPSAIRFSTILVCLTALLIFGVVYHRQIQKEKAQEIEKETRERFEGYERCTNQLDQLPPPTNDQEIADRQAARKSCRDFWFGGGQN